MTQQGELIGGPYDGLQFAMLGFWLLNPGMNEEVLAPDLLVTPRQETVPFWPRHTEMLVPPRPVAMPYHHYQLMDDKEYLYQYEGVWQWRY